jgi:hypothetical protein
MKIKSQEDLGDYLDNEIAFLFENQDERAHIRKDNVIKTQSNLNSVILHVGWFCDTMGERMGRIGRIDTDFFWYKCPNFKQKNKKKSVPIRPIRPIRSPIVSQNYFPLCIF